jgi:hypothetical protein
MPWIAKEKRRLSSGTDSSALRADSAQSALCAYLSLIALVGLGINAIWHVAWPDPVAALVVAPVIVWEGREAIRGHIMSVLLNPRELVLVRVTCPRPPGDDPRYVCRPTLSRDYSPLARQPRVIAPGFETKTPSDQTCAKAERTRYVTSRYRPRSLRLPLVELLSS